MKFAFVSTMLGAPWGGSEELWSQAAIRFQRAGHEVHALVPYRTRLPAKVLLLAQQGIAVQTYPSPTFVAGWIPYVRNRVTLRSRRESAPLRHLSPHLAVVAPGHIADG